MVVRTNHTLFLYLCNTDVAKLPTLGKMSMIFALA